MQLSRVNSQLWSSSCPGALIIEATAQDKGDTPLHYASILGHTAVVQLLLSKGADAHAVNTVGFTPADLAARHGHRLTSKLLLSWKSSPASTSNEQIKSMNHDDRALACADAKQPWAMGHSTPAAPNCVVAVSKSRAACAESAPTEEVSHPGDEDGGLSRLSSSDVGDLPGAVPPLFQPQRRDFQGGVVFCGCARAVAVDTRLVCHQYADSPACFVYFASPWAR